MEIKKNGNLRGVLHSKLHITATVPEQR